MSEREIRASQELLVGLLGIEDVDQSEAEVSLEPGHIRVEAPVEYFLDGWVLKDALPKEFSDVRLQCKHIDDKCFVARYRDLNEAEISLVGSLVMILKINPEGFLSLKYLHGFSQTSLGVHVSVFLL